jgi:hypothetical protein
MILWLCLSCPFPYGAPKLGMVIHIPQRTVEYVERVQVRDWRIDVAQLEGLRNTLLFMSFVRMVEEDIRFPGLFAC